MLPLLFMLAIMPAGNGDVNKAVEALRQLDRFQVDFRQETFSDFLDETVASGVLKIERPGLLRMDYTQGEQKTFICDGTTYYEKDMLSDSESRVPFDDLKGEPLVRLLLFGDHPEKHFKIDGRTEGNRAVFRMRPIDDDSYTLEITFDQDSWRPTFLEVNGVDGEGTRFWFQNWKLVSSFSKGEFTVPSEN